MLFPRPTKPEELYKFFTYGLPLTPLDWSYRWCVNATHNSIKRRVWYVRTLLHSDFVTVEYQPGVKRSDYSWYMYEQRYVINVHG